MAKRRTRNQVVAWEVKHEGWNMGVQAREEYWHQWAFAFDHEETDLEFEDWMELPEGEK
jgi:hypothetical protein